MCLRYETTDEKLIEQHRALLIEHVKQMNLKPGFASISLYRLHDAVDNLQNLIAQADAHMRYKHHGPTG